jgi:hypothetical protein
MSEYASLLGGMVTVDTSEFRLGDVLAILAVCFVAAAYVMWFRLDMLVTGVTVVVEMAVSV